MRRIATWLTAGAVTALLSACGVLNTFLPNQTLDDPLGIDGQEVILEPGAVAPAVAPQQTQGTWSQGASTSLEDIDTSDIPDWVDPAALFVGVGFEATATLSSLSAVDGEAFSNTFTFGAARLIDVSITDDQTSQTVNLPSFSTPDAASVTLQKGTCTTPPVQCTYTATSGLADFVIPVEIAGADMDTLYDILTSGSQTNTSTVTLELTATGTAPDDTTITVIIDAATGTLTF